MAARKRDGLHLSPMQAGAGKEKGKREKRVSGARTVDKVVVIKSLLRKKIGVGGRLIFGGGPRRGKKTKESLEPPSSAHNRLHQGRINSLTFGNR